MNTTLAGQDTHTLTPRIIVTRKLQPRRAVSCNVYTPRIHGSESDCPAACTRFRPQSRTSCSYWSAWENISRRIFISFLLILKGKHDAARLFFDLTDDFFSANGVLVSFERDCKDLTPGVKTDLIKDARFITVVFSTSSVKSCQDPNAYY